jgi:hypothetical protein
MDRHHDSVAAEQQDRSGQDSAGEQACRYQPERGDARIASPCRATQREEQKSQADRADEAVSDPGRTRRQRCPIGRAQMPEREQRPGGDGQCQDPDGER